MKKTTAVIALLISTAIAAPAHAGGKELGIGLGVYLLGKAIEGAQKGGGKRNKGDQLIGRVGEEPTRNNRARNRNKVAGGAAAVAGGAAVAAFALPEGDQIPVPIAKPTAEQMTEYATNLAASSVSEDEIDESVPLYDEKGRFWGAVAPADAQKVEQAVALGMKPSTVIPDLLGLKLPEVEKQSEQVPLIASTDTTAQQAAEAEADITAAVAAEGVEPIQRAKVDLPAAEHVPQAEIAVPEKKLEAAEVVPAMPSQATPAETKDAPPVDLTATTASVEAEPKVDLEAAKPVEVKKPKKKLDL
ncbi:hypothetical protein V6R85_23920 [Agrobacterium sp. CCNWLW32]|uniref:hypothetical protein n=1 Tax=Agrobacterium sp. CCNWLW32 TaxID=3122072 RepID=UPI00300FD3B1